MSELFPVQMLGFRLPDDSEKISSIFRNETTIMTQVHSYMDQTLGRLSYLRKDITDSIFCSFFSESVFFYTFDLRSDLIMRGLVIPRSDIRTVWKLYLKDILYITAAGTELSGEAVGFSKIRQLSDSAASTVSSTCAERINRFCDPASTVFPGSFALTDFPLEKMNIEFRTRAAGSNQSIQPEDTDGKLLIAPEVTKAAVSDILTSRPVLENVYLCRCSQKSYIDLHKKILKNNGASRDDRNTAAEDTESQLRRYKTEMVWFVHDKTPGDEYAVLLIDTTVNALESGEIDYYPLSREIEQIVSMHQKKKRDKEEQGKNRMADAAAPVQRTAPPKDEGKRSVLKKLFRK